MSKHLPWCLAYCRWTPSVEIIPSLWNPYPPFIKHWKIHHLYLIYNHLQMILIYSSYKPSFLFVRCSGHVKFWTHPGPSNIWAVDANGLWPWSEMVTFSQVIHGFLPGTYLFLVGGWAYPSEKWWSSSAGMIIPYIYIFHILFHIYIYPIYIPLFHIYPYKNKTCSKPPTRFSEFSLHIWIPSLPSRYKFRHPQYRIDCCDFMTSFVDFYIFIYPFEDMTMYIAARVWRYLYGCGSFCPGRSNKIPKKRTMPTKVVIGCTYTEFWWILMTDTACCSALGVRQNAL